MCKWDTCDQKNVDEYEHYGWVFNENRWDFWKRTSTSKIGHITENFKFTKKMPEYKTIKQTNQPTDLYQAFCRTEWTAYFAMWLNQPICSAFHARCVHIHHSVLNTLSQQSLATSISSHANKQKCSVHRHAHYIPHRFWIRSAQWQSWKIFLNQNHSTVQFHSKRLIVYIASRALKMFCTKFDEKTKQWSGVSTKSTWNRNASLGVEILNALQFHGPKVAQVSSKMLMSSVNFSP